MGSTYQFAKINRRDLFDGKFVKKGESDGFLDDEPLFIECQKNPIGEEMDNDGWIMHILRKVDSGDEDFDQDLKTRVFAARDKGFDPLGEINAAYLVKPQVERAIAALENLDAEITKMMDSLPSPTIADPNFYNVGITSINYRAGDEDDLRLKYPYIERCPCELDAPGFTHFYFGWCKEAVEMLKVVEKVYGFVAYHYIFPWKMNPFIPWIEFGSTNIQKNLKALLKAMNEDKDNEFVFLVYWF